MALRTRNGGSQTPDYWLKLARNTHAELMTMSENVPEEKPVQPVAEVFLEMEAHGITLRVTEQTPNKLA